MGLLWTQNLSFENKDICFVWCNLCILQWLFAWCKRRSKIFILLLNLVISLLAFPRVVNYKKFLLLLDEMDFLPNDFIMHTNEEVGKQCSSWYGNLLCLAACRCCNASWLGYVPLKIKGLGLDDQCLDLLGSVSCVLMLFS